jgi:hypothetical protein
VHHEGVRWDIDLEHGAWSRECQESLGLRAQPLVSSKEVAQLSATIAGLVAQARAREEDARVQLTVVSERLATSTARVSTLEGDLRAAIS